MAEKHLTTLKTERFEFIPEHQFVQYVLPCFVLFLLGMCKDTTTSFTARKNLMRFIDNLIASYEHQEYVQVLSTRKKFPIQYQRDFVNWTVVLSRHLTDFIYLGICRNRNPLTWKFADIILDCNTALVHEIPMHSKWYIQIDMFMKRVVNSLLNP